MFISPDHSISAISGDFAGISCDDGGPGVARLTKVTSSPVQNKRSSRVSAHSWFGKCPGPGFGKRPGPL